MTASNQNFTSYVGMAVAPIFLITDGAGNVIPLQTVQDIEWIAYKDTSIPAALTKKKSVAGGITFVTDGSDGKIQVNIAKADTIGFDGWYFHSVAITDAAANPTTEATGRWAVLQPGPL